MPAGNGIGVATYRTATLQLQEAPNHESRLPSLSR